MLDSRASIYGTMSRTVSLNVPVNAFYHLTQLGPFCQIFHVEADVVRFREVVEVGGGDAEKVVGPHGPDRGHLGHVWKLQW